LFGDKHELSLACVIIVFLNDQVLTFNTQLGLAWLSSFIALVIASGTHKLTRRPSNYASALHVRVQKLVEIATLKMTCGPCASDSVL